MNITVIIPTRNNPKWANEALQCVLDNSKYKIILIDDNSSIKCDYIKHSRIKVIKNKFKGPLSISWNQGVYMSDSDYVIIMSHKTRPNSPSYFEKMERLLSEGFAIVALHHFHFFGFHKSLFNITGGFDEGFRGGGYEDSDFLNRLFEYNLGCYLIMRSMPETTESNQDRGWDYIKNKKRYLEKWSVEGEFLIRKAADICYTDFSTFKTTYNDKSFLSFDQSIGMTTRGDPWPYTKVLNHEKNKN